MIRQQDAFWEIDQKYFLHKFFSLFDGFVWIGTLFEILKKKFSMFIKTCFVWLKIVFFSEKCRFFMYFLSILVGYEQKTRQKMDFLESSK